MHNRRIILGGLSASAALGLAGCSGASLTAPRSQGFSFNEDGDLTQKKPESDVVLNEKGLPSIKDLMKPGPLGEKSLGRADAPITMVKFASMTCPYCRIFHIRTFPFLKRNYIDKGKVRYILREFPIGRASGTATLIMRCIGQNSTKKYFALYDKLITQQNRWVSQEIRHNAIFKVASQVGITRKEYDACLKNQGIIDGLKWVKQRGRHLGVTGTPTFFINGQKYREVLTKQKLKGILTPYLA